MNKRETDSEETAAAPLLLAECLPFLTTSNALSTHFRDFNYDLTLNLYSKKDKGHVSYIWSLISMSFLFLINYFFFFLNLFDVVLKVLDRIRS